MIFLTNFDKQLSFLKTVDSFNEKSRLWIRESLGSGESRDQKGCCSLIVRHDCTFKAIWDWFVLILVIFTAIQIPYYVAFEEFTNPIESKSNITLFLGIFVDCMFIIDIFINFLTTYVLESDEVVTKPRMIAIHYLKTWFVVDVLAALPFEFMMMDNDGTPTLVGLLKSARLLRVFRIARKLDRYSEYGIAVLVLLMSLFTLIAHWFACIFNGIGTTEVNNTQSWVRVLDSRLYGEPSNTTGGHLRVTSSQRYVGSLYFIVSSMTSVGFGNIAANTVYEQIFTVILMLTGALMYACIFGSMVAIVQRLYSKATMFHNHMNTIKEFMKFYKIPEEIKASINTYVRREWNQSQGVDVSQVLHRFPDCMQADITFELYKTILNSMHAFDGATVSCMRALSMKIRTMTLHTNSYCIRQGEHIDSLYILGKGSLDVLIDGDLVHLIVKGTMFGYDFKRSLSYPKSTGNVRASSLSEIHTINKRDMHEVLRAYPKFAEHFLEHCSPIFDLCDETEEGFYYQPPLKKKYHVATIAKNALAMPIMARWTKRDSKKNGTDKCTGGDTEIEVALSNGSINSNCHNETEEKHLKKRRNGRSDGKETPCDSPSVEHSKFEFEYADMCERITSLQNQMNSMKRDFDQKFETVIELLKRSQHHDASRSVQVCDVDGEMQKNDDGSRSVKLNDDDCEMQKNGDDCEDVCETTCLTPNFL